MRDLTIKDARERLSQIALEHAQLFALVDTARKRIHEFAPSTRDYEFAEQSLTMEEIDAEFAEACAKTTDPSGLASRHGMTVETVRAWAKKAKDAEQPGYVRLVSVKQGQTIAYAMPYKPYRKERAFDLMGKFRDTLIRHGATILESGHSDDAKPDDVLFAEA